MRNLTKRLCTLALAFLLSLMALPVHAAGNKGYVVTFRPGEYGRFSPSYLQKIEGTGYSYQFSKATGSLSILVPVGAVLPDAPNPSEIQLIETRYEVLDAAPGYQNGQPAAGDITTVASYGLTKQGDTYGYTVRFVDRETGAEVAPALQGVASNAATVTFSAPTVTEFTALAASQALTIGADSSTNILTFYYDPVVHTNTVTEEVPQYQQAPGTAPGTPPGTTPAAPEGEEVPEEEPPLVPGPGSDIPGEQIIPDPDVPEAPSPNKSPLNPVMVAGIGVAAIALTTLAVVLICKRRGRKDAAQ
ncbi:hypothetical protein [Bittarella massiliensis (ex Durand et al. 2017)]|uniref:hypothetical protein n=1 Tax=Bittarella massiliensis (ex Durand et al. 2017) TaxID=1720313 RepID=UPI001AA1AD28|nr:hypothetical protein [Bittarella massiliensis (ex Durand et al. 2017)]MBO1679026.1 hypothetical protein [Bittarella massiliensis (ex Durand et al. 2017)]